MSLSLQIILTGLAAGSVYGLLAVAHTLVYQLTGIVQFALGDLVGLGVFAALLVTAGRGAVTQASASSWRFAVALVAGVAVTAGGRGGGRRGGAGGALGGELRPIHPPVRRPPLDHRLGRGERGDRLCDPGAP